QLTSPARGATRIIGDAVTQPASQLALTELGGELVRGLPIDELVGVAVAPHLIPGRGDLAHQLGMLVGHPAEDEEGGARAVLGEEREEAAHVGGHAARDALPVGAVYDLRIGVPLEVRLAVAG